MIYNLPPDEIFDVLHAAECAGVEIPDSVDKWWRRETALSECEKIISEIGKREESDHANRR